MPHAIERLLADHPPGDAVEHGAAAVGLEGHHHEQEIATLSGGQKSRVVFVELGNGRRSNPY